MVLVVDDWFRPPLSSTHHSAMAKWCVEGEGRKRKRLAIDVFAVLDLKQANRLCGMETKRYASITRDAKRQHAYERFRQRFCVKPRIIGGFVQADG